MRRLVGASLTFYPGRFKRVIDKRKPAYRM